MATEVNHAYVEQNTQQTTTSATWSNISGCGIAGSLLAANTKYLIIARAMLSCTSVNALMYLRIAGSDDATIPTKSEHAV